MGEIDAGNYQMAGRQADSIVVVAPKRAMTKREALVHAAWLVELADDDDEFAAVRDAVRST